MSVEDDGQLVVIDSGLPCDTFNFICRARLSVAQTPHRARAAIRYFRDNQRPFSWWVGPADQPEELGQLLQTVGLEEAETELAMAVDLDKLATPRAMPELAIRRVRSHDQLKAYARILSELWTPPDPHVLTFYDRASTRLLDAASTTRCYVAYLQDHPVGTAEMTVGGGVVGLYNIATVPEYRRRGIGSLLTAHPLLEAKANKENVGILQAAADGVSIYRRIGFQRVGSITEYKPPAAWFAAG